MWGKIIHIIQKDHVLKFLLIFFHSSSLKTLRPVGKWPIILQSVCLWCSRLRNCSGQLVEWNISHRYHEDIRGQQTPTRAVCVLLGRWHAFQLSFPMKGRILFFCVFQAKFYPKSSNLSHLWGKKHSAVDVIWIVSFHRNSCRMLPLV